MTTKTQELIEKAEALLYACEYWEDQSDPVLEDLRKVLTDLKKEMSKKHTPGLWEISETTDSCGKVVTRCIDQLTKGKPGNRCIAQMTGGTLEDAKLIAAAPDLLAACQEFVRKVECGEAKSRRGYKQMSEAIAKSTEGEE